MAGNDQHHIPIGFLRRFTLPDWEDMLWVFRGDKEPFSQNIKNIAFSRYFYANPKLDGENNLDEIITENTEKLFYNFLEKIPNSTNGTEINPHPIAYIIAHLWGRSEYIRKAIPFFGDKFITEGLKFANDPSLLKKFVGKERPDAQRKINEKVNQRLAEPKYANINRQQKRKLRKQLPKLIYQELDSKLPEQAQQLYEALKYSKETLNKKYIRSLHNETLQETPYLEKHVSSLQILHWQIQIVPTDNLVFPDCIAVCENKDGTFSSLLSRDIKAIKCVIFPLSRNSLAIGSIDKHHNFEVEKFNEEAVKLCFDYFLCASNSGEHLHLQELIRVGVVAEIDKKIQDTIFSIAGY